MTRIHFAADHGGYARARALEARAVAAGSVSSARLHQLDLHETLPEVSIGLLIPRQRALTPAAQQLIDALMANAAGSLEQGRP